MIDSYATLTTAIGNWLDRDDDEVTTRIPEFIQLAEAKIRRRVRRKSIRTTLLASTESTPVPADCAEFRSIYPRTNAWYADKPIVVTTPEALIGARARMSLTGRPKFAAIIGNELLLAPTPDQQYSLEVIYFEKLSGLSDTIVTNSVLADSPDIYLYGALLEAAPFLKDDDRVPLWQGLFDKGVQELDTARSAEELNGSLRQARLPVVFG